MFFPQAFDVCSLTNKQIKVSVNRVDRFFDEFENRRNASIRFLGEPMTEGEIEELIDEADVDDNGVIDYGEFYGMMDQKPKATSDKK